jgi:hypothetical protein
MKSLLLCLAVIGLVACHHAPAPPPQGEAAFHILAPVQPSKESGQGSDYVIPAEPILPLATPIYPKAALSNPPGAVTVGVRLDIDRTGSVSGVQTSLRIFSTPNSYDFGFRETVEAAVKQWRFQPARLQHSEVVKRNDGSDVLRVQDGETVDWSIDVAFTFTATGDVLAGVPNR